MKSFKKFLSLEYHNELNPKLWVNDKLKPEIKERLLEIGKLWFDFAKFPKNAILDYQITGSNCNYNYSPLSDIDLHIIVDPDKMSIKDADVMHDIVMDKKALWASKHNITIYGYPVELYAQAVGEVLPSGQGIYSLLKDEWVQHPDHINPNFNASLRSQVKKYIGTIADAIGGPLDKAKELKKKLYSMRGEALHEHGEFAPLNLVYKHLRNAGHLKLLDDHIKQQEDEGLSLK